MVLAEQPAPRRRLSSRIGLLHVVAVASGLLSFLLILMWMRAGQELVTVAVAGDTIRAGTIVPAGSVEFLDVSVDAAFDGRMLTPDEATRLEDSVATREITSGEPILDSDLRPVDLPAGSSAMSVPLDSDRAAGGDLAIGDRVDIIGTDDTGARYVAVGLPVLAVPGQQDSTFGASDAFAVTVAVDDAEALAIAAAVDTGTVHLLRSTGAPDVAIGCWSPRTPRKIPGAGPTTDMSSTRLEPAVCVGSSQRAWVTELISHVSDHGGMRVVGTALTQDDALRRNFDVLIVDDVSSVMSPRFVSRMRHSGRLVIAIYDDERGDEAQRARPALRGRRRGPVDGEPYRAGAGGGGHGATPRHRRRARPPLIG